MSLTMKKSLSVATVVLMMLACFALASCSGGSSSSDSSSASSSAASSESLSAAPEKSLLELGEKTDTALNVVFTNSTGSAITNFALQTAGSADQPTFLMKEGKQVADGEQVSVYTEPAGDSLFDAVVVCGDKQYTLHNLNFAAMDEATVRLEQDVAYIETKIDGNVVSSLQEEYDIAHPVVESQPEEAAQEVVQEQVPVADGAEEAQAEAVYYEEPAAEAQEAPAQSEDSCVSDIVLR